MPSSNDTSMEPEKRSIPLESTSPFTERDVYTVIVRGEEFQLTHGQISFDSPNYFLDCFTSGFAEARERVLRLGRNPALFALIVEYLSGYSILPLAPDSLPAGMGLTMACRCLLEDAQYYRLQRLHSQLSIPPLRTPLSWAGFADEVVNLRDVLAGNLPDGVVRREDGSVMSTRTGNPVLIFAQDMLLSLALHRVTTVSVPNSDFDPHSHPRSFALELSVPRHVDNSPPGQVSEDHAYRVNFTNFTENGFLYINDYLHILDNVFEWCKWQEMRSHMSYPHSRFADVLQRTGARSLTDRPGEVLRNYHGWNEVSLNNRTTTYSYWADMVLCTCPPPQENLERKNMLVKVKVRSIQRVLDELDPVLADASRTCAVGPVASNVVDLWTHAIGATTGVIGPGI